MKRIDKEQVRQGENKRMVNETLIISSVLACAALGIVLAFFMT